MEDKHLNPVPPSGMNAHDPQPDHGTCEEEAQLQSAAPEGTAADPAGPSTEKEGCEDACGGQQPQQPGAPGGQQQVPPFQPGAYQYQVDPQAYAAWQQAMWMQQMAAGQAAGMNQQAPFQPGANIHTGGSAPFQGQGGPAGESSHHLKHDEHKYGQMIQIAQRFLNGEADMQDIVNGVSLLDQEGNQFWRGLIAGGMVALVLGSESVRESIFSIFKPEKEK